MTTKQKRRYSFLRQLFIPLIIIILAQTLLFRAAVVSFGITDSINKSKENLLYQYASKSNAYLQIEMTEMWSDIKNLVRNINSNIDAYKNAVGPYSVSSKGIQTVYENICGDIFDTVRINSVDGAFVLLRDPDDVSDGEDDKHLNGFFIESDAFYYSNSEYQGLSMEHGTMEILTKYGVPLDFIFNNDSIITEDNAFLLEPILASYNHPELQYSDLGFWSKPFSIKNGTYESEPVITYSVPIIYNNDVYGIAGISITLNRIVSFISSGEVNSGDYSGYMIITYNEASDDGQHIKGKASVVSGGNIFNFISAEKEISLEKVKSTVPLYRSADINVNKYIYFSLSNMMLYSKDSPFKDTHWAIAAVSEENALYDITKNINSRVKTAMLVSLIIGFGLVYFLSRYMVKPVNQLAENIMQYTGKGEIKTIDSDITEIYELSRLLNDISIDLNITQNELIAEKERYFIALQNSEEEMFEYDPEIDKGTLYKLQQSKNNHFKVISHSGFISLVRSGEICHNDDISLFLKFLNGEITERFTIRFKDAGGIEGYAWLDAKGKPIYNSDNKLLRIIASLRNITESKTKELLKLDEERRDEVTKFYKQKYGEMLIRNKLLNNENNQFCFARLSISNYEQLLAKYGNYYLDAVLEEFSVIVNEMINSDDIVFRGDINQFIIFKANCNPKNVVEYFNNLRARIVMIHGNNEKDDYLRCCIGIALSDDGYEMKIVRYCTGMALCAAEMRAGPEGAVVLYRSVAGDEDVIAAYKAFEKPNTIPNSNIYFIENINILSFALNIFEKTNNFNNAIHILLAKTGRTLKMNRILIYNINADYSAVRIEYQWNQYDTEPIMGRILSAGKNEYNSLKEKFLLSDYIIADKFFVDPLIPVINDIVHVLGDGTSLVFPMFEHGELTGAATFETTNNNVNENDIACMREITKIISAYYSKSKTSLESLAKSEFLSRMSHEIRTPMNAIMGMTNIALMSGDLPEHVVSYLSKIEISTNYLMSVINNVLDISRIESGKMTVEETYLNIDKIVAEIDTMIRVQTDEKHLGLITKKDVGNKHLIGDPLKLKQVLINILGNAVKFTSSGSIIFSVTELNCSSPEQVLMQFMIKDTGIGISKENINRIFNSFEQADSSIIREYGGTGLGLTISSNLVALMGGKLEVESVLGEGTEFRFTLPFGKAEESQINLDDNNNIQIDFTNKRVLLVEDDDLNIEITEALLGMDGIITESAKNGQISVDMFGASKPGYYDAILMDIRMPVMDGLEATKTIRGLNREDAVRIPIVAMSANAFDADMKKSIECGMNGHLSKPIEMAKVRELFNKIWQQT